LKNNKNFRKRDFAPVGRRIRARQVRCIDQNGENLGVIDIYKALKLADEAGLDLVQIAIGDTPVCKILDYGKYKYDQSKQKKENARKQRETAVKIKEIKFRPSTGDHDLETKANQAKKFIEEGNRIKITVAFRGREMSHKDLGMETLSKFIDLAGVQLLTEPSFQGKFLSAMAGSK